MPDKQTPIIQPTSYNSLTHNVKYNTLVCQFVLRLTNTSSSHSLHSLYSHSWLLGHRRNCSTKQTHWWGAKQPLHPICRSCIWQMFTVMCSLTILHTCTLREVCRTRKCARATFSTNCTTPWHSTYKIPAIMSFLRPYLAMLDSRMAVCG